MLGINGTPGSVHTWRNLARNRYSDRYYFLLECMDTLNFCPFITPLVTLISAASAVLCTSHGPFTHLRRTPLRWRVCDVAVAMCRTHITRFQSTVEVKCCLLPARFHFFRKLSANYFLSDFNARPKNLRVTDRKAGDKYATVNVTFDPSCEYLGLKLVSFHINYWRLFFLSSNPDFISLVRHND